MTTPAIIEGGHDAIVVRCVDLDLDVIRRADGTWYVDDEDEFAEHQVALGYPPEVVAGAEAARDEVWAAAHAGTGAFDGRSEEWLARLRDGGTAQAR
jgi:protein associated with RNAse G/E